MLAGSAAALRRPERIHLREDSLPQLVPGPGQREGRVRVQALEAAAARLPADAARQLGSQTALFRVPPLGARAQGGIILRQTSPARDSARSLEPRDGGHEVWTGQVVGGREGRPRFVVWSLLGHRRVPIGAANGHAPKGPRRPANLKLDDLPVFHGERHEERGPAEVRGPIRLASDPSLAVKPGGDALDDEEALSRAYETEPPRLTRQRFIARRLGQAVPEGAPLLLQRLHLARSLRQLVLRAEVAPERAGVEQPEEQDRADREPAEAVTAPSGRSRPLC